jgi:hypothetical protein
MPLEEATTTIELYPIPDYHAHDLYACDMARLAASTAWLQPSHVQLLHRCTAL